MKTVGTGLSNRIVMDTWDHFFNSDELFNKLEDFDGRPEFVMFNKENFKRPKEGEKGPEVNFTSNMGPKELSPMSPDAPLMYQDLHYNLESWSVFRMLPQLLKWDRAIIDFY